MYRIGIDVGGTFTDLVALDAAGRVTLAKAPSTPADPSLGVMDGLERLAEALGVGLDALLDQTERIVHGTTVATNALLERKGARVGLLTTEGHRDVLEMREGLKDDRYDLRQPPPEPLVPRHRRLGVRERIRADGRVETPLDEASLAAAIAELARAEVEAVAVCYLHAWRDDRHERQTAEALRAAMPSAYVSLSSAVLPQIKEYERVCTTVVNAYVGPALERYLGRLGDAPERGRLPRADPDHPVARRPRDHRRCRAPRRGRRALRARGRGRRQPSRRAPDRPPRPDPVRHGRHQHRHLAGRGRRRP